MVKLKAPLLSLDSKGTLGDIITMRSSRGLHIAEKKPIPTDPGSYDQLRQRLFFKWALSIWNGLSHADRDAYNALVGRLKLYGYNLCVRDYIAFVKTFDAFYPLYETAGIIAHDLSPNTNHAIIHGATHIPGKFDYALSFDGIDDYLDLANPPILTNFIKKTLLIWYNPLAATGSERVMYDGGYYGTPWGELIHHHATLNQLYITIKNTAGTVQWSYHPYAPNAWHLIGYTWDGTIIRYYRDGAPAGTDPLTGTLACTPYPVYLGKQNDGTRPYKGYIDGIIITRSVMSAENIKRIWERR